MAVTLSHLKTAVADLEKEDLSLNGTIAVGVFKLYVKQQEENKPGEITDAIAYEVLHELDRISEEAGADQYGLPLHGETLLKMQGYLKDKLK